MKKSFVKSISLTTVFVLGIGLMVATQKQPTAVSAEQHIPNFDEYTYSGSYYSSLDTNGSNGLSGTFNSALSSLIFPKGWYTYGSDGADHLSSVLQSADEDPTNSQNMIYLYTRDSVKKNAASSWNREHVWPQSLSNNHWGTGKAGTDILHIRPTYNTTNSTRGNLKYGEITSEKNEKVYNGMTYGYTGSGYFEPLDSVKGDVARIIMYLYTTYNSYYGGDLKVTNVFGSYDTLLKWHTLDRPDVSEGYRNDYSETSKQKNRNPFVDHPEYAWRIYGDSCSSSIKNACMEAYPGTGGQGSQTKTLQSIAISGVPNKTSYFAGETFDPAGLTVTATYDDNSTEVIANNNCAWTPSPLSVGTTSITCTYNGKTAVYQGVTVTQRQLSGEEYSLSFVTASSDDGTEIKDVATLSGGIASNTLIEGASDMTKVYRGKDGLKLGSSSNPGSITFTLKSEARVGISKITIKSTRYSSDTGNLILKLDSNTIKSDITPGKDEEIFLDGVSAITMTLSTSTKRAYLQQITVTLGTTCTHQFREWGVKQSPTCLLAGVEYRVCTLCGAEETRTIAALGHKPVANSIKENEVAPTCENAGSYDEVIYCERCQAVVSSEHKTIPALGHSYGEWTVTKEATTTEAGSEHRVCSTCGHEEVREIPIKASESSEPPVNNDSSQNEEPTVEPKPSERKGCFGSAFASTSLFVISALAGLSFILIKRKRY